MDKDENAVLDLSSVEGVTPREGTANPQDEGNDGEGEGLIEGLVEDIQEEESEATPTQEGEETPASKEAEETPSEGNDEYSVKDVANLYLEFTGEPIPTISPELTAEEKESLSDDYIEQYETKRRLEMIEGKDFYREKMSQGQVVADLIETYAKVYSNEDLTLSPKQVFNHMREKMILSPEDAVKSLVFDHAMDGAKNKGAKEALKKASAPTNPAKTMTTRGRPVGSTSSYKSDSDAHAGGVALLNSLRAAQEGR